MNNEFPPQEDQEQAQYIQGMIDGETGNAITEEEFNRQQAGRANSVADYGVGAYQAPRYQFESDGSMVDGTAEEAAADAREDVAAAFGGVSEARGAARAAGSDTRNRANTPGYVREQISAMESQFTAADSPAQTRMQRIVERAQGAKAWAQEKAATPEGRRFMATAKAIGRQALMNGIGDKGLGLIKETEQGIKPNKAGITKTAAEILAGPVGWRAAAANLGKGFIGGARRGLREGVKTHGKAWATQEAGHQYRKMVDYNERNKR